MDDQPPPAKKSRFFSNRQSLFISSLNSTESSATRGTDEGNSAACGTRDGDVNFAPTQHALAPPLFGGSQASSLTPTATKFRELTVEDEERTNRRKGIYGVQDLYAPQPTQFQAPPVPPQNDSTEPQFNHAMHSHPVVPPQVVHTQQHPNIQNHNYPLPAAPANSPVGYGMHPNNAMQGPTPMFNMNHPLPSMSSVPVSPLLQGRSSYPRQVGPGGQFPSTGSTFYADSGRPNLVPYPLIQPLPGQYFSPQGVDVDRDAEGRRITPGPPSGFRPKLDLRPSNRPRLFPPQPPTPSNLFTSPERLEKASTAARAVLKRKRSLTILPPPAYVYQRTDDPGFNIFHGFLLYPELCFQLATHLQVNDLVSLYAISRDFHTIIDTRFTTVILSQAIKKAPESARSFPFRAFGNLCRQDPAARIPHPNTKKAKEGLVRYIPSFRWLKMVLFREQVVHQIMTIFAEDGIPMPRRCGPSLKKMWFMLDIPDNARRIGFAHSPTCLTDLDLYFMMVVLVKCDMRFHDPAGIEHKNGLLRMIWSQKTLTVLLRVLRGEIWRNRVDVLKEWVKYKWEPRYDEEIGFEGVRETEENMTEADLKRKDEEVVMFGLKRKECGVLKKEHWGQRGHKVRVKDGQPIYLLRPDQIVLREAMRRGLRFNGHYFKAMTMGYVRPDNLENFAPRDMDRRIAEWKEDDQDLGDVLAPVHALRVEEGGDALLDLGPKWEGSEYCIKKPEMSNKEKTAREEEASLLERLYAESEMERLMAGRA